MQRELRWVSCEMCGGSGELIELIMPGAHQCDTASSLCPACEGTGRDCVEVSPITEEDLETERQLQAGLDTLTNRN